MPQVGDINSYVYEGVWTNWSKGAQIGATLTLSPKNALLVISVISIFLQLSGTQLWRLMQFGLHQLRATAEDRDGLYHQQQVILRNGSSELGAVWHLIRVAFAWRTQKTTKSYQRSAPLILLAVLHSAIFILLGVFSSRLLDAGDEVLLRSPYCGDYNATYLASLGSSSVIEKPDHLVVEYLANAQSHYQQSQQYVQFCSKPSASCKDLPQDKLPWNWTMESYCPFDQKVCSPNLNQSIVIDTGLISSHRHLGLNAPEEERLQYRKVTTCTVLNDAEYISDWKDIAATSGSPAKRVVDAYYGSNRIADRNASYSYSEWNQYYSFDQYSDTNPYQINVQQITAGDTTGLMSDIVPIPELVRADADIILMFLSFSKVYESPVNDPWFSAQKESAYPTHDNINVINGTVYTRERPVTTLACTEQHQLCVGNDSPSASPDSNKCTPLAGWYATSTGPTSVDSLNLTAHQVATATRVFTSAVDASFFRIVSALTQRDTPLLARRFIQGLIGLQLPNDQWRQETLYWHSLAMAHFQRSVIDYSSGSFAADTSYINTTLSPQMSWLCQNQIIRGTPFQSYNFLTIMLIAVFGSIVVIAGYTIEDIVAVWRMRSKRLGRNNPRQDMWVMNEMLEMLSLLYGRHGRTVWTHSSNDIPVAGVGQKMKMADLQTSCPSPSNLTRRHRTHVCDGNHGPHSISSSEKHIHEGRSMASSDSNTPSPQNYRNVHAASVGRGGPVTVEVTEVSGVTWAFDRHDQPSPSPGLDGRDRFYSSQRSVGLPNTGDERSETDSLHSRWPPAEWFGRAY